MTADLAGRTVGFVGLGHMGTPMAAQLAAAGVHVRGHDAADAARDAFAAQVPTAEVVPTPEAVASGAEAVLLCLPDSDVVGTVVGGGLLDALEPGAVLVDMSSSEPLRTRELAERAAKADHVLLDAPVSGGVSGARAGTLSVMVGGDDDAVAAVWPLLSAIGRPRHVGPTGAGHALKALNNLMSAAHLLASSEALLVGEAFGLDPEVMLEVVNASTGRSGSTEVKWPRDVLPGTFASGFGLGLMLKDIRIALDLARTTGSASRHAASTVGLWAEAAAALPPDADHTEIVRWLRRGEDR
ncbi:NAD(P)-dependent oxidoreductase [Actinomycetospora sp. TBRC 11914]|uniref:NAD(P)-dependent oxidoreductase n=1 Tax=Actinomycetospora sp. TBRC 11914 TaxID=2729387 RepID=UPI00145DC20F|nr:NAD(P)-dependent oxidoreductase [Actinomycetospora sp. TBRC 11914]NMO88429.1 NAD(P)-dependent oxidoreductase [Actinomycetospora sp. TBRC 11914]